MNASQTKKLVRRAIEIQLILDDAKPLYSELDQITADLVKTGQKTFKAPNRRQVVIVDNFQDKNSQWKSVAMRRFEIKIISDKE